MLTQLNKMALFIFVCYHRHVTDCLIGSPFNQLKLLTKVPCFPQISHSRLTLAGSVAIDFSCIMNQLLGYRGWVHFFGGGGGG